MRTRAPRALQQNEYPEEMCWCGVKGDPSVGIFMTDCSCTFVLCVQRCHWRPLTDINTAPGSCARIEPLLAFSTRSKPELYVRWTGCCKLLTLSLWSLCVDVGPVVYFPGAVVPLFLWSRDTSGVWPFTDARTVTGTVLMFTAHLHIIYGYIRDGRISVFVGLLLTIIFVD